MQIHIVNPFANATGGSECAALELARGLRGRGAEVLAWSQGEPDPRLGGVRRIAGSDFPDAGTLIVYGNYFPLGPWLSRGRFQRVVLVCNTFVRPERRHTTLEELRCSGAVDVAHVSRLMREWIGVAGPVHMSRIDLERFRPNARGPGRFSAGRISRDVPEKHHFEDVGLYARLAAAGVEVRVMGGTCLASVLSGKARISLLPEGATDPAEFLRSLDCFLYRTALGLTEAGGRVIAEAMACALPVVAHRRGGYAEWIEHGHNGFLFDTTDEAYQLVMALRGDAALRARIGEAARRSMERMLAGPENEAYFDFYLRGPARRIPLKSEKRIHFAWELGGNTGHAATLMPLARALRQRGHSVRFSMREPAAGRDLDGAADLERELAPFWSGPVLHADPLSYAEILENFGYGDADVLKRLVEAWRERLAGARALVANASPAAHLAARTLRIARLELSHGYDMPPAVFPTPPLRDWDAPPRARLEAADRRVLAAMNAALSAHGAAPLASVGSLFAGAGLLATYPELDVYPQRGPAEYFGILAGAEGSAAPEWPRGAGPRVLAYFSGAGKLEPFFQALAALEAAALVFWRGADDALQERCRSSRIIFAKEPLAVSRLLPHCDLVACHGSHQMTAQALLAGKPLLLVPTQLEQFLITRRVVRYGAALGVLSDAARPDYGAALGELARNPAYREKARAFAARYASHDRSAALATIVERCERAAELASA